MKQFELPVVLIIFKRTDTVLKIIDRLRIVKPQKVYILADHGRDEAEKKQVIECRKKIENAIDWNCSIIRNYADENRGVYANIALGAKWVFEREEAAIFLEDDNLPEVSFFEYCQEMLDKYKDDDRILWVCGTNYLGEYKPENGASYMFTRHLLPCGWASWSNKFLRFYDFDLELADDSYVMSQLEDTYFDARLCEQQKNCVCREKRRMNKSGRFASWDYHMALSIRANNLFGISPCVNQIKNIGVDGNSTHGGNSMLNIMTRRFCGMDSGTLNFPIEHPKTVCVDVDYEKKITHLVLYPWRYRVQEKVIIFIKRLLRMDIDDSLKARFRK